MIIDATWRLVPYLLFSAAVWALVFNAVLAVSSLTTLADLGFWVRLVCSAAACLVCIQWIHRRHQER